MIYKGGRAGFISQNGLSDDILRSGFQKEIRRGNFESAIWYVNEYDLIHELVPKDDNMKKGIKIYSTGLCHRLLIISIEDIGIGNPWIIPMVDNFVNTYKGQRDNHDVRREALFNITYQLSASKKSRELSHIRTVYNQVYTFDIPDLMSKYSDIYTFNTHAQDPFLAFKEEYVRKSDACFYWYLQSNNPISYIDHVISMESNQDKVLIMNILRRWFKEYKFKEYTLFGMMVILLGLRDIPKEAIPPPEYTWQTLYDRNIKGDKIQVEEYVLDKHTRVGRANGVGLATFAIQGSHVENEHPITNQVYKELYIALRQIDPKKLSPLLYDIKHRIPQEEIDKLYSKDTPHGQLLTGYHKKYVFIPTQGTYKGSIIKGPWKADSVGRLNRMIFRMKVLHLMKVKVCTFCICTGADGHGYVIFRNISSIDPSGWKLCLDYDKCVGSEVYIVDRASMGILQMHHVSPDVQMDLLFGKQFIFKALVLMALLRIGDVGLYNIILSDGVAHIIDYEEDTTRDRFIKVDQLLAKGVAKYTSLFIEGIHTHKDKVLDMVKDIDEHITLFEEMATKYGHQHSIHKEWSNIKEVILSV